MSRGNQRHGFFSTFFLSKVDKIKVICDSKVEKKKLMSTCINFKKQESFSAYEYMLYLLVESLFSWKYSVTSYVRVSELGIFSGTVIKRK